jgi:SAM-dependent methyltransferase
MTQAGESQMAGTLWGRMAKLSLFGRSPLSACLRLNEWIWNRFPRSMTNLPPISSYGHLLHSLVLLHADRRMYLGTFFLRNRPELELIRRLSSLRGKGRPVKMAVLGSSNGAEVYSIIWAIRSAQPELELVMHAVDISPRALEAARQGVYSLGVSDLVEEPVFARLSEKEMQELFDREGDRFRIKPSMKEGITWHVGDATDPRFPDALGLQHIVVANRFLCHMGPPDAERCLRNIARLVAPGGYLFVSGIDLDVRRWQPISAGNLARICWRTFTMAILP